ncbi:hypothetical protein [Streptomyces sp. NBC_01506]|uniref:hypothetical protein n=1 Tax=Streptomyces sp. NBC_01506 TaxID=2903887 RepID=UPI0038682EEF
MSTHQEAEEHAVRWSPQAALAYMDRQEIAAQLLSMPLAFAGSDDAPGLRDTAVAAHQRRPRRADRRVPPPLRRLRHAPGRRPRRGALRNWRTRWTSCGSTERC